MELEKFFDQSKFLDEQYLKDISNESLKYLNICDWKISIAGLKILLIHKRLPDLKNLTVLYIMVTNVILKDYKEFNDNDKVIKQIHDYGTMYRLL